MSIQSKVTKTQRIIKPGEQEAKAIYDSIFVIQTAINMAIAENRVVLFKTDKTNKQIKSEIENLKGCLLRKPDRDSEIVAVIPPGIENFCFEKEVDESIEIRKSRIVIPKPIIYTPYS